MDLIIIMAVISLTVSGFMVGNEIAVGVFVHPQLWKLDGAIHIKLAQPLAKINGSVMPFWYFLTFLSSAFFTYVLYDNDKVTEFWLALIASALWLLSIVFTISVLVPINNRVAKWNTSNLPGDWAKQRHHWDRFHLIRIVVLIIAFILLSLAVAKG